VSECEATRRALLPYVDGELVGEERRVLEEHLRSCPACRRAYEAETSLVQAIRETLPRPAVPPELRARVEALAATPGRTTRRAWLAGAVAAGLALLGVYSWHKTAPEPNRFVSVAIDSHLRYAAGRLPLEVRSAKPDEVSRFFAGRVPFNLTLPDYPIGPGERKFYDLEGGRLVSLTGDYGAYVAYKMDGRPISLLAASSDSARPSGRQTVTSGALTFHLDSVAGLNVITWTDKGLTYALVSDLSVGGEQSCLVCHGSPSERRKIPGFGPRI
jgi:anti-sigma factor (TIGR02949 family)